MPPEFREVLDLSPHLQGSEMIGYGVCYDGSLAVVAVAPRDSGLAFGTTEQPGWATFPKPRADKAYDITFLRFADHDVTHKVSLPPCDVTFPHVQVFADDSILLVSSRCAFNDGNPDQNAWLFSASGELLRRFCVGDGIERVQVARNGDIWVSYFDEGVYGNFGWLESVANSGLACFDNHGKVVWSYKPPEGFEHIDDCYAMSVCGDTVYACYYSSFPIVAINEAKEVTGWTNGISAATAIASDGKRVVLYENRSCVVQTLGADGALRDRTTHTIPFPSEKGSSAVVGHDANLHVVAGHVWYRLRLDEL